MAIDRPAASSLAVLLAGLNAVSHGPAAAAPQAGEPTTALSVALAGENLVRPGLLLGLDIVAARRGVHELVVSPQAGFTVFAPFNTSLTARARALYRVAAGRSVGIRVLGITAYYDHRVPLAPVYRIDEGTVERARDAGYGRPRLFGTTGLQLDLSEGTSLPLTVYVDVGMSAEPYFGVARFHLEHALGVAWTLGGRP